MIDLFKKYGIEKFYFGSFEITGNFIYKDTEGRITCQNISEPHSTVLFRTGLNTFVDLKYGNCFVDNMSVTNKNTRLISFESLNNYYSVEEVITKTKALQLERKYKSEYLNKKDA